MKSQMERARFAMDRKAIWRPSKTRWNQQPFNFLQHVQAHPPVVWTYTSKATLDTVISTPWYPPQDYIIESVRANVTGAPVSTALVWDVLIGGSTIFANTAERPQIAAGALFGRSTVPSRQGMPMDSKVQVQGITLSSATGPLVLTFQLTTVV